MSASVIAMIVVGALAGLGVFALLLARSIGKQKPTPRIPPRVPDAYDRIDSHLERLRRPVPGRKPAVREFERQARSGPVEAPAPFVPFVLTPVGDGSYVRKETDLKVTDEPFVPQGGSFGGGGASGGWEPSSPSSSPSADCSSGASSGDAGASSSCGGTD